MKSILDPAPPPPPTPRARTVIRALSPRGLNGRRRFVADFAEFSTAARRAARAVWRRRRSRAIIRGDGGKTAGKRDRLND